MQCNENPNSGYSIFYFSGLANNATAFSSMVILTMYFENRRSLAMGISICGLSIGSLVFAPFVNYLFTIYGFTGTLMIQAGVTLHLFIVGALFIPLKMEIKDMTFDKKLTEGNTDEKSESNQLENEKKSAQKPAVSRLKIVSKLFGFKHLKSVVFIMFTLLSSCLQFAFFCVVIYMSGLAKERCNMTN